jgi:hypothetical protein
VSQHFRRFDPAPDLPFALGRHELHDDRSRPFDAVMLLAPNQVTPTGSAKPLGVSVTHLSHTDVWDQGEIGSCTANAALGVLMADPFWARPWMFTEADAQQLYHEETLLDDVSVPGHWPPADTGSTGLWSMRALQRRGLIRAYVHCFGLNSVIATLENRPVSVGVPWYDSMFYPDAHSVISVEPSSGLAGGHQIALVGVDADRRQVLLRNSWGPGWGDNGYARLSYDGLNQLLHEGGDAVTPVVEAGTAALVLDAARRATSSSTLPVHANDDRADQHDAGDDQQPEQALDEQAEAADHQGEQE